MKQEFKVGIGTADITPPLGVGMVGYYYPRLAKAVHDPLTAKAVIFDDGKTRAALIACGICHFDRKSVAIIRSNLAGLNIVSPDRIVLCASHTHTGPEINAGYIKILTRGIGQALRKAYGSMAPAALRRQTANINGLFFNRRYFMKNGDVATNPGKCNPDVIGPAGPVFKEADVLWIDFETADVSWAIVNVPGHPDIVGGEKISADYPYFIEKTLKSRSRRIAGIIYTNAPCGDINHWDIHDPSPQRGFKEAKRIGQRIGEAVADEMKQAKTVRVERITTAKKTIRLPYINVTRADIKRARSVLQEPYPPGVDFTMEVVEAQKIMRAARLQGKTRPISITAIGLGSVAFVGMPAELFAELGMEIKRRSPFETTLIHDLAFVQVGYIAPAKAWKEGGYEVASSIFKPGVGEKIVRCALDVLKQCY